MIPSINSKIEKVIDGLLNIFYSKNKTKLYVLILFILGLLLRLIAANNLGLYPDDANHGVMAVGMISSEKLEEIGQSAALWYYILDFFYRIFGTSPLSSRMATALFSSFSILLMFLFVKQVFKSEKAGLICAVLTAFSPFFIKMTLPEIDIAVLFFIMFSALFLFKFIENQKRNYLILCSILMGIAIMIKVYALIFAFSFFLFMLYFYYKQKVANKIIWKNIFIFLIIIFVFCTPTLINNYLLYKDKGFVDLMFTNFFKIGVEKSKMIYPQDPNWHPYSDYIGFFLGHQKNYGGENAQGISALPGFMIIMISAIQSDPWIIILGLLGIIWLIYKKNDNYYVPFFIISFIPIYVFLGATIPMLKHFNFVFVLFTPLASLFIEEISTRLKIKFKWFKLRYVLSIIILFNLIWLGNCNLHSSIYATSAESNLINSRIDLMTKEALVIVDSRIYRGNIAWMFNDRYYLESSLFGEAIAESSQYGDPSYMKVYFVECVIDDCGWGTIANQPEFNKSMEDIVSWFVNKSKVLKEIDETEKSSKYYIPPFTPQKIRSKYKIYEVNMMLNPSILQLAKSTHIVINGFPVGYDSTITPMFDDYQVHNFIDKMLRKFAFFIMYSAMVLCGISLFYILYLFLIQNESFNSNSLL